MSIVEKRSAAHDVDDLAGDWEMSPVTSICVGLVLALAIYVLGSAILSEALTRQFRRTRFRPKHHLSDPEDARLAGIA